MQTDSIRSWVTTKLVVRVVTVLVVAALFFFVCAQPGAGL